MAPVTPKTKRTTNPLTPQSVKVSPTTSLITRSRARLIIEQGEDPFAHEEEPTLRHHTSQRWSRNNIPVTPPSSPSAPSREASANPGTLEVQPQPFPQQQRTRQGSPSYSETYFAPAQYAFPKERTPFAIHQEEVDEIARLARLPLSAQDAYTYSPGPSDPTSDPSEMYYRAPTPGVPIDWSTMGLSPCYSSSEVLRNQLKAMTPEERASHHEYRQYIRGISRGTTPALSTYYAPTPRGAPLPLLPSPIVEVEEPALEAEPVRLPTPGPEPVRRARLPSSPGLVRSDRKASLRSYASHSALSTRPPTMSSRPRRASAKYRPQ
jgi:hypothetical protein